jgi:ribosomal protein S18 acetylase RimI-like enzyme
MTEPSFTIRPVRYPEDVEAVLKLWQASGPGVHLGFSDSPAEIARKLERDPDLFLVAEIDDRLVGTVIGGYDGRRGLVYHLAVDHQLRQNGIGTALMQEVEQRLRQKGCYKAYLLVVKENPEAVDFYQCRGWSAMDVTIMGKELNSDESCSREPC